jgi:hypothetical protein
MHGAMYCAVDKALGIICLQPRIRSLPTSWRFETEQPDASPMWVRQIQKFHFAVNDSMKRLIELVNAAHKQIMKTIRHFNLLTSNAS